MPARPKLFALIAIAVGFCAAVATFDFSNEPTFHGRTLSYWVKAANPDDPRTEPSEAIRQIGTRGLPFLLQWISYESKPSLLKESVHAGLVALPDHLEYRQELRRVREWTWQDPREYLANCAAEAFGYLGEDAKPVMPALVRMMNDDRRSNTASRAIIALGAMGEEAVPHLLATLGRTNAPQRCQLALSFTKPTLKPHAQPAVPILGSCLYDDDVQLQEVAAWTLGVLALQPDKVIPALTDKLAGPTTINFRVYALSALEEYGTNAVEALPMIRKTLNDANFTVRMRATNVMRAIAVEMTHVATNPP
jgi:hypothetical protein